MERKEQLSLSSRWASGLRQLVKKQRASIYNPQGHKYPPIYHWHTQRGWKPDKRAICAVTVADFLRACRRIKDAPGQIYDALLESGRMAVYGVWSVEKGLQIGPAYPNWKSETERMYRIEFLSGDITGAYLLDRDWLQREIPEAFDLLGFDGVRGIVLSVKILPKKRR